MGAAATLPSFSETDAALLRPHVTSLTRNIYCIRNLPPEVVAVLFAYVSRSPNSFRANLLELLRAGDLDMAGAAATTAFVDEDDAALEGARERARAFHEKWVVGYGHASVAEHASLRYAVEDVSIHAAKFLEDNRLGSYTEKSTRYQVFTRDSFHVPEELDAAPALRARFVDACRGLFAAYETVFPPLRELLAARHPRGEKTSPRAWENSLKAKACDVARYLLPAATLSSLGISFNARSAEHAISKCLSHPLAEVRAIGAAMLEEGTRICPALLKYAARKEHLAERPERVAALVRELLGEASGDWTDRAAELGAWEGGLERPRPEVRLTRDDAAAEERIVAAILFENSELPYEETLRRARAMEHDAQDRLLEAFFGGMGKFEYPLRACEHAVFQVEMLIDYGAFRDIQRHRLATLTEQPTTCRHGYLVPPEIDDAGLAREYGVAMDAARATFRAIEGELPHVAPLVVAQGFLKRVLFSWNLRELEHFIRLRSARAGHVAYRWVAQECHRLIEVAHPRLARWLRCDHADHGHGLGRLEAEERAERKREATRGAEG